jgi:tetratricopeptide (TPR) repeat protein
MRLFVAVVCLAAGAWADAIAEANYEKAVRAVTAEDYPAAFGHFEAALLADPDNVRFGSEYRQAVVRFAKKAHPKEGQPADWDRLLGFFEKLVAAHPKASNAFLNFGFTYVDKIPAAGSISQVILANTALTQFSKSIELQPSWIALYTRGNSYLFWPKIFNRAQLGVNDLEQAYRMHKAQGKKSYHVRVYVSLGDGYWKTDNIDKAKAMWKEGLDQFPGNAALQARVSKDGDELKALIEDALDPNKRVDTNLREIWENK